MVPCDLSRPPRSLTDYTGYSRADGSYMDHGSPSGEAGVAYGGPIIQDALGFRVSAWYGHDGGYIDRVSPLSGKHTRSPLEHRKQLRACSSVETRPQ